jgi:Ca2+-transporting ATPase
MAAVAALAFYWSFQGDAQYLEMARTAAFGTIAFAQLSFSFACRSHRYTLPQLGPFSNPWLVAAIAVSALLQLAVLMIEPLRALFGAVGVSNWAWLQMGGLALVPVTVVEVAKLIIARVKPRRMPG